MKRRFLEAEQRCDSIIKSLPLLELPLRTVLTATYIIVDCLFNGSRSRIKTLPKLQEAHALSYRLSYLVPFVLNCPSEEIGANADDAMSLMTMERYQELAFFIGYGNFCEIAPEVRRDYFDISCSPSGKIFTLNHKSEDFLKCESKDIVLSELALPFFLPPKEKFSAYFDNQIYKLPVIDFSGLIQIVTVYMDWFHDHLFECSMLSNDSLINTLGVSLKQFQRFRLVWMAIAQYHIEMAAAISRKIKNGSKNLEERLAPELLEWISPYYKEDFITGIILKLANINLQQYHRLMELFCISTKKSNASGDGFFPPFLRLADGLIFQPNIVQIMLSLRNVPYALNKIDKTKFDQVLSPSLEPRLLEVALKIFKKIPNILISQNIQWDCGEIDMLVYEPEENTAIHVQAKAAIPPQGSRLVQSVESRISEGIRQLQNFRKLSQERKDEVIGRTFSIQVKNTKVVDAILVWASFGTEQVWKQFEEIAPLTIPILFSLIDRKPNFKFAQIKDEVSRLIEEIIMKAEPMWKKAVLELDTYKIEVPVLEHNAGELLTYKLHLKQDF